MKKATKITMGVSAAAMLAAAVLTPVLVMAYGDNTGTEQGRPVYTNEDINKAYEEGTWPKDKITFNSITNARIGDERNFVGAIPTAQFDANSNQNVWNANDINVQDGETYTIRLYVHNNNPYGMEGIAKNVVAHFSLPTTVGKELAVTGYLDSSNATPTRVFDEVVFKSNENFYLKYVDGSATYTNKNGTFNLSDDIIVGAQTGTGGAMLGYTSMNGEIPGCYEYNGEVHIQVTAHKSVTANVQKKVRLAGTDEWSEVVDAKVGDEVEYMISYTNLLNETAEDVTIRDVLPTNVEYVAGSTVLYNTSHPAGATFNSDDLTTTGINIGDYESGIGNAYVQFTGKVVDKTLACGSNQLVNWANATVNGEVAAVDDASVMVNKECSDQPVNPDEPTPDNPTPKPETPSEIVSTGAGEIVTGAIGAGSMVTALGYYVASRKKLM